MKKLILLLILFPASVDAQESRGWKFVTHSSIIANGTLHFADLASTEYAFGIEKGRGRDTFKELNPLFRPLVDSPIKVAIAKSSVASLQTYIYVKYHTKHPKLVTTLSIATSVFSAFVVRNNMKEIRKAIRN